MVSNGRTRTDTAVDDTLLTDAVIRLRRWGTDSIFPLPPPDGIERAIGSHESCWLQLHEDQGRLSRTHAMLVYERDRWIVRDTGSKNGIKLGRIRHDEIVLEPGMEIWIGGVTLLAESTRSASLRAFLGRVIGWTEPQLSTVDAAIRALRMTATHRSPFVVCGEDAVVSLARSLHRRFLGPDRPFVICDPRRRPSVENVRNAANFQDGMAALAAATRGSICIWNDHRPHDFDQLWTALQDPDVRSHLVICTRDAADAQALGASAIVVPPLTERKPELRRIVQEYASDAVSELGVSADTFKRADLEWVLQNEATTLAEIEKATLRLVALRQAGGNVSRAATRLGMARMSLFKWIRNRALPMPTVDD